MLKLRQLILRQLIKRIKHIRDNKERKLSLKNILKKI